MGVQNTLGLDCSFVLPIFKFDGQLSVQDIDDDDRIASFKEYVVDEDYQELPKRFRRKVLAGDLSIHAFFVSKKDVLIGTRYEISNILSSRISEFVDKPNLLSEIAEFAGEAKKRTRASTKNFAKSSETGLTALRRLGRRLRLADHRKNPVDFESCLRRFQEELPLAIPDVVLNQPRTANDLLADLIWVLDNDIKDIQELADEQAAASVEGRLQELWVCARYPLDCNPKFFDTVRQNLQDGVKHFYFLAEAEPFEELCDRILKDKRLKNDVLKLVQGTVLDASTASGMIFDFAIRNPGKPNASGYVMMIKRKGYTFINMTPEQVGMAVLSLSSIKNQLDLEAIMDGANSGGNIEILVSHGKRNKRV